VLLSKSKVQKGRKYMEEEGGKVHNSDLSVEGRRRLFPLPINYLPGIPGTLFFYILRSKYP
jgi:hypothetical protein